MYVWWNVKESQLANLFLFASVHQHCLDMAGITIPVESPCYVDSAADVGLDITTWYEEGTIISWLWRTA